MRRATVRVEHDDKSLENKSFEKAHNESPAPPGATGSRGGGRPRKLSEADREQIAGAAQADPRHRARDGGRRRARGSAEMGSGQLSYLTGESKSGSTIRIDRVKSVGDQVAVYFHCQTNLVETFRELYPELSYSGNRAIVLDASKKLPEEELRHCVALALTYHRSKRKDGHKKL